MQNVGKEKQQQNKTFSVCKSHVAWKAPLWAVLSHKNSFGATSQGQGGVRSPQLGVVGATVQALRGSAPSSPSPSNSYMNRGWEEKHLHSLQAAAMPENMGNSLGALSWLSFSSLAATTMGSCSVGVGREARNAGAPLHVLEEQHMLLLCLARSFLLPTQNSRASESFLQCSKLSPQDSRQLGQLN